MTFHSQKTTPKYCSATFTFTKVVNTPDGDIDEIVTRTIELNCFEEIIAHLQAVREQHLNRIADLILDKHASEDDFMNFGGFACELHNRFGGVVEFALGAEYALMMRLEPEPFTWYRNGPNSSNTLDFYIDGGHHTEFKLRELATRNDGLSKLKRWLETGEFPENVE